jgi:hypothetical protein
MGTQNTKQHHNITTTTTGSSPAFQAEKKSQNKNFNDHVRTIFTLMPKLTATMVMFVSLDEFWATSEPKSGGAS